MVPVKLESDRTGVDGNLDEDSRIIIKSDAGTFSRQFTIANFSSEQTKDITKISRQPAFLPREDLVGNLDGNNDRLLAQRETNNFSNRPPAKVF